MFEVRGKFNSAKVFTDNCEEAAYKQILNLLNQKFAENSQIRIMPDTHAGAGCVIGFTQKIEDKVVPNLVGVDIGCGMLVLKVTKDFIMDLPKLDKVIHQKIPSGPEHRQSKHPYCENVHIDEIKAPINTEKLYFSIGTLGGGNHFIEVDADDAGDYYIVIHSGSRHLGKEVATYYQNEAIKYHENQRKLSSNMSFSIPNELAYLEGELMQNYLYDMNLAQEYALWNREAMLKVIIDELGIKKRHILDKFCTVHNYINMKDLILRKGSISLHKDELAIIPINMREGSLIVRGKGNPDWNCSGPHGAGRLMSRSKAKESLKMEDYKEAMKGIYTTCVSTATIDESPMAYKPIDEIIENIQDTAEIVNIIKPIYNFKAAE